MEVSEYVSAPRLLHPATLPVKSVSLPTLALSKSGHGSKPYHFLSADYRSAPRFYYFLFYYKSFSLCFQPLFSGQFRKRFHNALKIHAMRSFYKNRISRLHQLRKMIQKSVQICQMNYRKGRIFFPGRPGYPTCACSFRSSAPSSAISPRIAVRRPRPSFKTSRDAFMETGFAL